MAPEFIAAFVRNGINVMPPFRKTEITDEELIALTDYLNKVNKNGIEPDKGNK